nr:hypothetical protein [Tanacetum cinerariifolium]GEY21874.1 hypothetical protein [Tanacetum cinerariifolium]GEY21882.1 hypothetical protein [Tanacetum cinerariifolium]
MCLGHDIIEVSSDLNEGPRDWDSPKYKDIVGSGGKKEPEALVFHKRKGKKLVKKELMVSLHVEIYIGQFLINPEEDEFELGLIFESDEEGNPHLDDLEMLLDFDEIPQIETDLLLMTSGAYDHKVGSSRTKCSRHVETIKKALLINVHHEFLEWRGCNREVKSRYNTRLATLLLKLIYSPHIMDWKLLHKIGCGEKIDHMLKICLKEAQSNEEIFFSEDWVRAFNIQEPIYPELYNEFYATYEFDEVCADDELQSKNKISFRIGGRAYSRTLLEFPRRLVLYHADEFDEEGFDTYFQGGLRSDENFNAREYWENDMDKMNASKSFGGCAIQNVYFTFPIYLFSIIFCIKDNAHIKYGCKIT